MTKNGSITFGDVGVSIDLLKILDAKKFINPTPIQAKCIPLGLEGKDVVGIAQTGTGKTLAFGLPAIEKIINGEGRCLIMLPTRELAIQVEEVLYSVSKKFRLKTALLIGGVSARPQKQQLKENPHIIIATPGRLIDHIHQGNCRLDKMNIVILDEADRMLDIGFMPQIKEILGAVPAKRQTMLFSATMPEAIAELSKKYMRNPVRIEVSPAGTSARNIEQSAFVVSSNKKRELLRQIVGSNKGSILVFTRTKYNAKKITQFLKKCDFSAIEMHSDKSLNQRKKALEGFKKNHYKVLVATDVAARGIDVDNIALVVNFNLPEVADDYVHRIGRTGRANKNGKAISFVDPAEKRKFEAIKALTKKEINILEGSESFSNKPIEKTTRQVQRSQWENKRKPVSSKESYGRRSNGRKSRKTRSGYRKDNDGDGREDIYRSKKRGKYSRNKGGRKGSGTGNRQSKKW